MRQRNPILRATEQTKLKKMKKGIQVDEVDEPVNGEEDEENREEDSLDLEMEDRLIPFDPELPSKDRSLEEDPKPPRSDRDIIEEALYFHDNLEVLLRGNSMDEEMHEVFRSEIKLLESEVEAYSTCPDFLLSVKIAAIEARIRKIKSLRPAILNSDLVKEVRAVPAGFSENEVKVEASVGEDKKGLLDTALCSDKGHYGRLTVEKKV
ncbi:hypothetical protein U1Q18_009885 [Sarracenia purpurea var. burkii]